MANNANVARQCSNGHERAAGGWPGEVAVAVPSTRNIHSKGVSRPSSGRPSTRLG